ncbi:MAG: hypothetical protein JNK76_05645 [Planctomycetales bacterium]|nr:hypothetical protein [Planctomycetales bacterium]MBN8626314.1 hypothetical protein [Planctomycetota bacterium]
MTIFFTICAVLGCTVLACQFFLTVTGLSEADDLDVDGHDIGGPDGAHDAPEGHADSHAHGSNWFFGVISFRTVTAAMAFFGLTGLAMEANGVGQSASLAVAAAAGVASMYFVHWMMRSLALLKAEGTTRIQEAVGAVGSVYIKIPGHRAGQGKVTLTLQGRTVELNALTGDEPLPTGARIVVTKVVGPDAVEVAPAAVSV